MSGRYTTDYAQDMRLLRSPSQRWLAVAVAVVAVVVPFALTADVNPPLDFPWAAWLSAINLALVASIGAAAFNLLLGYTHQISVAQAAFLMLGTIVGGSVGVLWGQSFLLVLVVSLVAGAVIGAIVGLPALRFRGLYLLIATFGVHFFAFLAYKKFQTRYFGFNAITFDAPVVPSWLHWLPFVVPDEEGVAEISGNFAWYWVLLVLATLSILFMANVLRTREGRSFMAIAEHDVSASLIGIDVTRTKLLAFSVSSAFVTMTGAIGAYYIGARGEDSFPFYVVLLYAIMIIVGGFSSLQGAVFGAFFVYLAPVFFDWVRQEVPGVRSIDLLQRYGNEFDQALFGVLIIVVLVSRPTGLVGIWKAVRQYFATWPYST